MLRAERHEKILELIARKEIETQEELCEELNRENYVVTQATISRDIRDLHLFKVAGIEKKYRYAYIGENEGEVSEKMRNLFKNCVVSVAVAQNLVVVKTMTGNGANAGAVVDKLNLESVANFKLNNQIEIVLHTSMSTGSSVLVISSASSTG